MRVVAYSIKAHEKESLARANQKKHDITLISNPLCPETLHFAAGKDAVLLGPDDRYDSVILQQLAQNGIRYVLMRCPEISSFKQTEVLHDIQTACLESDMLRETNPDQMIRQMAEETIEKLDYWQLLQAQKPA